MNKLGNDCAIIYYHYLLQLHVSPSFPPKQLIDTLGAGDTFNAAIIHMMSRGASVRESVTYACKLAGTKCGMEGFEDLRKLYWLKK